MDNPCIDGISAQPMINYVMPQDLLYTYDFTLLEDTRVRAYRRQFFPVALVTTLLMLFILTWVGQPLITPVAPNGIISYEFAGSSNRAREILNSWGEAGRLHAAFSLGLDFLFIIAYVTAISLACLWAGDLLRKHSLPLSGLGLALAWSVCLAGVLDGIENIGLIVILLANGSSPWPQLAAACAAVKFLLILLALFYAVYAGLAWVAVPKRTN